MAEKPVAPRGTIHVILSHDPTKVPEVQIDGEWTHRQIISVNMFVLKAFRSYMAQKRSTAMKEISDEC